MIIHKSTKSVETSSISTNKNFGNYENVFVVDDSSELGQKILINQPYFDFVLDNDGNLIDIIPIERPPQQPQPLSEIETLRLEQVQTKSELITIKQTFNLIPPIENTITLEDYQKNKIYELNTLCNQTILNGFYSTCRGTEEFYSFSDLDQTNIMGYISMLNSDPTIQIIWKSANETLCTLYTREQMIQLAKDGLIHKQQHIYRFEVLRNQVMECVSIEEISEIVW